MLDSIFSFCFHNFTLYVAAARAELRSFILLGASTVLHVFKNLRFFMLKIIARLVLTSFLF